MNGQNQQRNNVEATGAKEGLLEKRRAFLGAAGIGALGGLVVQDAEGAQRRRVRFKVLGEKDRLEVGDRGKEMIEKAYKSGYDLEKKHGGCARCTVAALQTSVGFVPKDKDLFRAAGCLDGGATPDGVQSCGGFTGAGIVIGWVCGNNNFGETRLCHKLIRKVCERFEKEYGSVLCKNVREKAKKNCPEVVGTAAKWTAEVLLGQFTDYEQ